MDYQLAVRLHRRKGVLTIDRRSNCSIGGKWGCVFRSCNLIALAFAFPLFSRRRFGPWSLGVVHFQPFDALAGLGVVVIELLQHTGLEPCGDDLLCLALRFVRGVARYYLP